MENDVILSIGQYLATARKNKGLSLEEVSDTTKIKIRLLELVEQNKFDELGGAGYAKAIIDTYAKALEAKDMKLQKLLDNRFASKMKHNSRYNSIQPKRILIPTNFLAIIILVIIIIILVFTSIKMSRAGMMKSPLKQEKKKIEKVKEVETTKKDIKKEEEIVENNDQNKTKNSNNGISIKPKMLQTAEHDRENRVKQEISLNENALRDSSDFLKNLMFKGKNNPFL